MAQTFARQNRTPQRFTAENLAVNVPLAGNTTLLDMVVEGADKLSVQVDNTVQALDAFIIQGRVHRDASYVTFASVAGDYTTPTAANRLIAVTGAPVTLAASASAAIDMDVSGLYSVKILASGGNAIDSVVSIYASGGSAAGLSAANITATLTAGDIEVGAVELKNAVTDDRALIAASGATPTFGVAVLPVVATAAAPSIAEGKATYLSTDLAGATRVAGAVTNAVLTAAVGGGTAAASLRVNLATDVALPAGTNEIGKLAAGTAIIGKVGIDQTTPGTTNNVSAVAPANQASGQVTSSTTAATLVAARATRSSVSIKNTDTTITVYVGPATVTAANGMPLKSGESISIDTTALIQVIAASGTPTVAYYETYF